jgi:hypothetical protein
VKIRNISYSLIVGLITLTLGLAAFGVWEFFFGNFNHSKQEIVNLQAEGIKFDINDPESVLPIDYEEDKLTSPKVDETNAAEFDPEGFYYFLDEPPKGFEDLENFTINNKNLKGDVHSRDYGKLVPPSGYIQTGKKFEFSKISIGDGNIFFETKEVTGINYEFNGKFLVKGNFYTLDEDAKVLEGVLTKRQNGKIVAESNVTFGWFIDLTGNG